MQYKMTLAASGAREMVSFFELTGEDQRAEEYAIGRRAVELYRDEMLRLGKFKWPRE